jgi:hypothetical protein
VSTPPNAAPDSAQVQVRRAPKIPAFLVVGGLFGFLATLVVTSLYPADPLVGFAALLGYFSLFGVTAGVLLGAVLGIVLDRRSQRAARTIGAEREVVEPLPVEGELED